MPENETGGHTTSRLTQKHDPKSDVLILSQKSRGQSMMVKSGTGLRGTAQWEALMRKFSASQKETCKRIVPKDLHLTHRNLKKFPSGSTYAGTWNVLGMSGQGTYTFPHQGVVYKGGFDDGMFHGDGELQYECGAVIKGKWNKGQLVERHLFFADGLEYEESDWAYCRPSDRRFTIEYDEGLEPAGRSYLTADQPTIPIPPGHYDVGDGFYDPITKLVYKYGDSSAIERAPNNREQQWIADNCRGNPDNSVGPCPFLYETWVTPTLELPTIPKPDIRYNTQQEMKADDGVSQHQYVGRAKADRVHLFTSRIGLCSNTAFYSPGRDLFDSKTDLKESVHNILTPKKTDIKQVSSVAFKASGSEIVSKTVTVKVHEPLESEQGISEWGLAEHSTAKLSKSYGGESIIRKPDIEIEKHDIGVDASFEVTKSSLQLSRQSRLAKDSETYKSKTEAGQYDADNIKAERSAVTPKPSIKIPTNITSVNRRSDYTQEIAIDPETNRSPEADRIETKSSKMSISPQNLQIKSEYKQETVHAQDQGEQETVHTQSQVEQQIVHAQSQVEQQTVHAQNQVEQQTVHAQNKGEQKTVHAQSQVEQQTVYAQGQVEQETVHASGQEEQQTVYAQNQVKHETVHAQDPETNKSMVTAQDSEKTNEFNTEPPPT